MCVLLPYPADVAAYSQPVFALRNPDCAADHHSDWGDPPDSNSAECPTVTGSACVTSLHSHFSLSQGDQSPDDGGSRLLTAHCHPNCPNSGSNCSACSGKGVFTNSKSNLENSLVLKTLVLSTSLFQTGQTIQLQGGQQVCSQKKTIILF